MFDITFGTFFKFLDRCVTNVYDMNSQLRQFILTKPSTILYNNSRKTDVTTFQTCSVHVEYSFERSCRRARLHFRSYLLVVLVACVKLVFFYNTRNP